MNSRTHRTSSIHAVFGDSNLVLSILSFLYKKTDKSLDFLTNTPIALHILSFKSLYYEFHKLPNLQIESHPIQYLSSYPVYQWAISIGYSGNIFIQSIFDYIVDIHQSNAIHFIEYTMTKTLSLDHYRKIASYATKYGHIHLLEQVKLVNPTFTWERIYINNAISGCHLQIIQWLRAQNPLFKYNEYILLHSVQSGHLHILQWLCSQDSSCPWSYLMCAGAAHSGHLHILQWLRSQNPPWPWDSFTCLAAAQSGHLHILQWVRSQDPPCPWDISECLQFVDPVNSHMTDWLESQI